MIRSFALAAALVLGLAVPAAARDLQAQSQAFVDTVFDTVYFTDTGFSCAELWWLRNSIYARNGYRFQTARGIQYFGSDGWTSNPRMTRPERANVANIRRAERILGCTE